MRLERSPCEVNAAIRSLLRIRGSEVNPRLEGLRGVWHQGAHGADLISYVDERGHLMRQEFTLFNEHFLWTSERGLRTGRISEESSSTGLKASPLVSFDREIDAERVERANEALGAYGGNDRYILHLKRMIALMLQGLQSHDEETITSVLSSAPPSRASRRRERRSRQLALALGAAAGVLAMAAAVAMLLK